MYPSMYRSPADGMPVIKMEGRLRNYYDVHDII